jgi:hypothetical protein
MPLLTAAVCANNKIQNRIGLVNGIAVSIHHIVTCAWFCPVAFIFDEPGAPMVNRGYARNRRVTLQKFPRETSR